MRTKTLWAYTRSVSGERWMPMADGEESEMLRLREDLKKLPPALWLKRLSYIITDYGERPECSVV